MFALSNFLSWMKGEGTWLHGFSGASTQNRSVAWAEVIFDLWGSQFGEAPVWQVSVLFGSLFYHIHCTHKTYVLSDEIEDPLHHYRFSHNMQRDLGFPVQLSWGFSHRVLSKLWDTNTVKQCHVADSLSHRFVERFPSVTILSLKNGFLHRSGSYKWDGSSAWTSAGNM